MLELQGVKLHPYIMGSARLLKHFAARSPLPQMAEVEIFDPRSQAFYRLVNAGNNLAFGGLGMPAWVQLDCATLPSAMFGFAIAREDCALDLWSKLCALVARDFGDEAAAELEGYEGLVPVSEYCALPTPDPEVWVGFSLYALLPGLALGVRTKALALHCYGAGRQVGMTQYTNKAVQTHCAFGALRVVEAHAPPHSRPWDTFIYEVDVSDAGRLARLVQEGPLVEEGVHETSRVEVVAGQTWREVAAQMEAGPVYVVAPGVVEDGGRRWLLLARAR